MRQLNSACQFRQLCTINRMNVLPQTPYFLNLDSRDFCLFPKLKSVLKGRCFNSIGVFKFVTGIERHYIRILPGLLREITSLEQVCERGRGVI